MTLPRLLQPSAMDELFLHKIARLLATAGAPVIRLCEGEYGITRREWRILAMLAQHEGVLSSELALHAHLDRTRTSRAVTALVAKKLVSRVPLPGDRRAVRLALTPAGHAVFDALFPQAAAINVHLLSVLDDAQVASLDRALDTLQARADATAEASAGQEGPKADRRRGGRRPRFAG